jgi:excinuclease ABC subunit A
VRIWLYGQIVRLDEITERKLPAQVMVMQDRVTLEAKQRARISEAVEAALRFGKGKVAVAFEDSSTPTETRHFFSTDWSCADCGITLPAPTSGLVQLQFAHRRLPDLSWLWPHVRARHGKAIPDESLSINQGLVRPFQGSTYGESQLDLERAARKRGVDIHKPFRRLQRLGSQMAHRRHE